MKNNYFLTTIALMALMISCTDDFNEINEKIILLRLDLFANIAFETSFLFIGNE